MNSLDWPRVQWIIDRMFEEDLGQGDITTASVATTDRPASARIVSKDHGVVAGLAIAKKVFETRDAGLEIVLECADGETVAPGDDLLKIFGSARAILEAERTALNLLGRLSGIATQTRRFVENVSGTKAVLLDTRKTGPLIRELDKYAVRAGGAQNHRTGLYDMVLIKENHVRYAGSIAAALQNVHNSPDVKNSKVEIEVRNLNELRQAMAIQIDRIMLDNFSLQDMRRAVEEVGGAVALEASGGVTLETVRAIAETGVDFISVGALTHSVKNFDMSLLFAVDSEA